MYPRLRVTGHRTTLVHNRWALYVTRGEINTRGDGWRVFIQSYLLVFSRIQYVSKILFFHKYHSRDGFSNSTRKRASYPTKAVRAILQTCSLPLWSHDRRPRDLYPLPPTAFNVFVRLFSTTTTDRLPHKIDWLKYISCFARLLADIVFIRNSRLTISLL